jgi:hypothetical protein
MTRNLQKSTEKNIAFKREHTALQKMKFIDFFYFCGTFLPSLIRIANPDPYAETPLNPDPIRIRIDNTAVAGI